MESSRGPGFHVISIKNFRDRAPGRLVYGMEPEELGGIKGPKVFTRIYCRPPRPPQPFPNCSGSVDRPLKRGLGRSNFNTPAELGAV